MTVVGRFICVTLMTMIYRLSGLDVLLRALWMWWRRLVMADWCLLL